MTESRRTAADDAAPGGLEGMLGDLRALSGEIDAAMVLGGDGGVLAATAVPPGVDRERLGAMLGALAGLARRTARDKGGSGFSRARVKAEGGYVLLVGLAGGATLAATTGPEARVGLVLYDMRNAGNEIERAATDAPAGGGER
jgi:predicted regulator of Ras-like GTPase activity (Roadblock/LC7/MglB family)